jgi:hypothetical protein
MKVMPPSARVKRVPPLRPIVALICAVAVPWLVLSPAAMGGSATTAATAATASPPSAAAAAGSSTVLGAQTTVPAGKTLASATLQQCATATIPQTERAATFAGEMTAIAGTARMEIRIDLEERGPEELLFHMVSASGLGVWHSSGSGVKIFAHIQQVTNLSAPALYRGDLRFRWLNDKNRPIKSEELHTARCEQPASPATSTAPTSTPPASMHPTSTSSSGATSN